MTDLRRAAQLFHQVRELPPEARDTVLRAECADDPALRSEVESLLRAADEPVALTRMLDASVGRGVASMAGQFGNGALTTAVERATARSRPQRIGQFIITDVIARGGMGAVYEARQQRPARTVALKVLTRELATESARRRFEYEAQLLGQLRHPGIAQIYEAGLWEDADEPLPYFAMELVVGALSITQYAELHNLGHRRRLELFAQACDAVHHAHRRGVIHRDLKPGNILIDESGAVKVIDFGVARSIHPTERSYTRTGQLIGTLQYMSPEQCDGQTEEIDVRSDVYALGVVLFELIVGELPYDVAELSLAQAARIIRERQPVRPSSTTTGVRGEIDWIALKALEKEPQRRYQSAHELAHDIRAYLSGDSVSARPPTLLYQARVLARRHRTAAVSIVVGVIMLAIAATGTTAGLIQAERHRKLEQKALNNAVQSIGEFRDLFTATNPATGRGRTMALETLDDAIAWAEQVDFEHQPGLQVAVLAEVGRTQLTLGLYIPATHTLFRTLAIAEQTFPPDDLTVARILDNLGAALLHSMLPGVTTEAVWRRALGIYRANFPEDSAEVARAKYQLALAVLYSKEGRQLLEEALETQRQALEPEHAETLATMTRLAWRCMDLGEEDRAEPLFRTALDAQRRTLGDNHPAVASTLLSLGEMLGWYDRNEEAGRLMGEALAIRRAVLGPEHPATAEAERVFAGAVEERGDLETAATMLEHAEGVLARSYPPRHNSLFWTRRALGRTLTGLGRHEEAIGWHQRAIENQTNREGKPTHNAGWGRASLAETYWAMGRQPDAIDQMRRAIEVMLATGGSDNNRLTRAEKTLNSWLELEQ